MKSTEDILRTLKSVEEKGSFYAEITERIKDFKIDIQGFGPLAFPVTTAVAKKLLKCAVPARFGWKTETVLDTSVRNVMEIPASLISVMDTKFQDTFQDILEEVKSRLGLAEFVELQVHLHNLLIYEKGGFFLPHRDSEKEDNMLATLVVVLPCEHRGGDLVINHHKKQVTLRSNSSDLCHYSDPRGTFIAFYADCYHEVQPITSGVRMVLTYNVVRKNQVSKKKHSEDEKLAFLQSRLEAKLKKYFEIKNAKDPDDTHTFVYLLDHSYTEKNLSWKNLKNIDHVRAYLLKKAAENLGFNIYLTLADVQECWDAVQTGVDDDYDDDDDDDEYSYRNSKKRKTKSPKRATKKEPEYELIDLMETTTQIKHWIDAQGQTVKKGSFCPGYDAVCWTMASSEHDPYDSDYEGYTGNAGNTLDRWYHRAALVVWPSHDDIALTFHTNPDLVLKQFAALAKKENWTPETTKTQLLRLKVNWARQHFDTSQAFASLAVLALGTRDPDMAVRMLKNFELSVILQKTAHISHVLDIQKIFGDGVCFDLCKTWFSHNSYSQPLLFLQSVKQICALGSATRGLLQWLFEAQFQAITPPKEGAQDDDWDYAESPDAGLQPRLEKALDFLVACAFTNYRSVCGKMTHLMANQTRWYPPFAVAEALLEAKRKGVFSEAFFTEHLDPLFKITQAALTAEYAQGLRRETDWTITFQSPCSCTDCAVLNLFLRSNERRKLWPLAEQRRRHIHNILERSLQPVTHNTLRGGRPCQLVLEKTLALHTEAQKRYKKIGLMLEGA